MTDCYCTGACRANGWRCPTLPALKSEVEQSDHDRRVIADFIEKVERRAEGYMLRTGKLEGMHYAAMKDIARELGIELRPAPQGIVVESQKP